MDGGLLATFDDLDRVALVAEHGAGLPSSEAGSAAVDHIGPALEIATLAQTDSRWSAYAKRSLVAQLAAPLRNAHRARLHAFTGTIAEQEVGFMCLTDSQTEDAFRAALHAFDLGARRVMRFKRNANQSKALVCGAIGEMVDNVLEHSGATPTGIVAFASSLEHFDVCVSDAGMGVLASLRSNPAFAYLSDSGMALSLAIREGTSRYPASVEDGHGHGFGTLFRGLNSLDAEIRLRSGDYALEVGGRGVRDRAPTISQKAHLPGLIVSFRVYF